MTWGFLSAAHFASLALGVLIVAGLYIILRQRSDSVKIIVLGVLSFSGICAVVYNLLAWNSPLEYLPLHLCSLNAIVLPVAVFTRSKVLNNLLLFWSLGALFALLVNVAVADAKIISPVFAFYYFPHVLEFGIPILMFSLKLVKKDVRCIASTLAITIIVYTAIHFVNIGINNYTLEHAILDYASNVVRVNYMYSLTPENPMLDLFYSIIPHQYWYMYLALIPAVPYLALVYFSDIVRLISRRGKKI